MKKTLLLFLALSLAGCASYFKRKQCESINWFEHGKSVAMRGAWLNSDQTVMECRKAEAEIQESQLDQGFKNGMQLYCSPAQAYQTGKGGDFFSRDICEGPQINVLLDQHKKGVADYCAKSNGQQAGASGKKYQNICPKNLEANFLTEYRKGRKRYVNAMIDTRQSDIRELESKVNSARYTLSHKQGRLSSMKSEMTSLEAQKTYTPLTNSAQHSYLDSRIQSLSSEISSLRSQVSSEEGDISSLERTRSTKLNEITDFKAELPSLED